MVMRLVRDHVEKDEAWQGTVAEAKRARRSRQGQRPAEDVMPSEATETGDEQRETGNAPVATTANESSGATDAPPLPDMDEQPDGLVENRPDVTEPLEDDAAGDAAADAAQVDASALEALLLSTHHPLTSARLAELLELPSTRPLRKAIGDLNEQYAAGHRSFRIEQVAGGYQILTLPEFGDVIRRLHQKDADAKLTKAALETLAIIAYKQPILRADIEAIRGVACGETIRSLMEKHLVKIAGRAEEPGRPILYGTTKRFLELFGLNSLKDLPQPEDPNKPRL